MEIKASLFREATSLHSTIIRRINPKIKPNVSNRELQVLHLIADEYIAKEIATKLYISIETVNSHRKHLLQKFSVRNTAGLIREAFRHGIIS